MNKNAIDKTDPIPRYLQVRRILEEAVRTGRYRPGAQLPGERELALELKVSQMTVNKALQALASDGWLRREAGRGTFVLDDFRPPLPEILRIGFAIPTTAEHAQEDFYLGSLLRGIQRAITNCPINLTLLETGVTGLYDSLMAAPIDGCLLTDVLDHSYQDVLRLAQAGKHIIIVSADREPLPVPYVDSDNFGGAGAAVQHLIDLGHRRIAGIFAYSYSCNTRQRLRGYESMLQEHGLAVPPEYRITLGKIEPALEEVYPEVKRLLAHPVPPTAFFCGGFHIALETMKAVRERGLRIPEDVSVVGFDDPVTASYLSPPLTTVYQPLEEMGRRATLKLLDWLRTQEEPAPEILPAVLQVRSSSAPAPAGDHSSLR